MKCSKFCSSLNSLSLILRLVGPTILLVACSQGPKDENGTVAVQSSALSQADASTTGAASPAPSIVGSIALPPWTECAVQPASGSVDPSHSGVVFAGSDGKVHFTPPPPDWGTKLTFNCSLSGSPQGTHLVDFNDTSTFTEESQAALDAQPISTRPGLTGDPTALSNSQLLEQGYPPRPDPQADPSQYSRWLDAISRPVTVFQPVPITHIGLHAYGQYIGSGTCNWTGFVQSADSFPNENCGLTTNWTGTTYSIYHFYSSVPWITSAGGTALWAGIGGLNVSTFGVSNLIQSGFWMTNTGVSHLFVEFTPGFIVSPLPGLPSGDQIARGDQFYMWGWSASTSACAYTGSYNNTNYGCFGFQNITKKLVVFEHGHGTASGIGKLLRSDIGRDDC